MVGFLKEHYSFNLEPLRQDQNLKILKRNFMTLYRLTIYDNGANKSVEEFDDEDDLRDRIDDALNDIEKKAIKTFSVSWISESRYPTSKPFWEK